MVNIQKIGIKFSVKHEVVNRWKNLTKKGMEEMKAISSTKSVKVGQALRFLYTAGSEPNTIRNVVVTSIKNNGIYETLTAWDFKRGNYRTFSILSIKNVYVLENAKDGLIYGGNPDTVDNRTLLKAMTDKTGQYSVYNNEEVDKVFIFDNTVKTQECQLTISGPNGTLKIFVSPDSDHVRVASTWGDCQCELPSNFMWELARLV